jgi:alpha-tubulin suppressor-like RCC1 family protein
VYDGASSKWRVVGGTGSGGSTGVTYLATSSQNFIPILMDGEVQYGNSGTAFIYRNQLYTIGNGAAARPYGVQGGTSAGAGNTTDAASPSLVPIAGTAPSGWQQVVGGIDSVCALSNVGTVYCWGNNDVGQLGQGDTTDRYNATIVSIPSSGSPIVKLYTNHSTDDQTANYNAFFAVDANGYLYGWGPNDDFQLGLGTSNTNQLTPIRIASGIFNGGANSVVKLSMASNYGGGGMVAAITQGGQLYTWGYHGTASGLGIASSQSSPYLVPGMTNVKDVIVRGGYNGSTYRTSTFAIKNDGTLWVAGSNINGQLGLGDNTLRNTFVQVTSLIGTNITKVYSTASGADGGSTYVVDDGGNLYVTGYNGHGQLALGDTTDRNTFQEVTTPGIDGKVAKVFVGGSNYGGSTSVLYVLNTDGDFYSAGYAGYGLGRGTTVGANTQTLGKVIRNTNGAKVIDVDVYGYDNESTVLITLEDGTMMSAGYSTDGQTGNDVNNLSTNTTFKYVIGFEPGSKASAVGLSTIVPFNLLNDAVLGGLVDNTSFSQIWNWSTASTTTGLLKLAADVLTTGNLFSVNSASTNLSGNLAEINLTGDNASTTGNALKISVTGTQSVADALELSNLGAGLALNVSGSIALQRGADYTTAGTSNNAPLANSSLVRLNTAGATDQVLTGIAGGVDGKLLTIMNVHNTATVTLSNNSGSSLAANRILTGMSGGASMQIGPNQSVQLMYDGAASVWRVISGAGGSGATTYVTQLLQHHPYHLFHN